MADFRNDISWSKSRDGKFRECLRAYWFHYYGSWGGWDAAAPDRNKEIYRLKNVRSKEMWAGDVVHRCCERALTNLRRGIEPLDPQAAIDATIQSMRDEWARSRSGDVKERLTEHEYAIPVPDAQWRANAEHVRRCLATFYRLPLYEQLRSLPSDRWLEVESLQSFELENVKVFVKLDASYRTESGEIVIIDWKTGRARGDDHSMQIATYVLYASQRWGVPPEQVETQLVYLASGEIQTLRLEKRALDAALSRIQNSIRDMLQKVDSPESNAASEEDFPAVDSPRLCRRCNYRRICLREKLIRELDPSPTARL